jgi:capsular polysaccharide biosynthesis protein
LGMISLTGLLVCIVFTVITIVSYFLLKFIVKPMPQKEISIYVDEKREHKTKEKVFNTPYNVERNGKERLSSDILDDTIIDKIKKTRE